jgi:hypothetical protein
VRGVDITLEMLLMMNMADALMRCDGMAKDDDQNMRWR